MNILFVTPTYSPMPGGGERYAASLATHLRGRGHQVEVVTSRAIRERDLWDGTTGADQTDREIPVEPAVRLPVQPFPVGRSGLMAYRKLMVGVSALPGNQRTILSHMAQHVPRIAGLETTLADVGPTDIIHAFNLSWESAAVAAAELAKDRGLPLVVTPFAHLGVKSRDRVARNSTMDHQLDILRRADGVLVLTDVERSGLADYRISAEKITVLGGGVDPAPVDLTGGVEAMTQAGLPETFVLFVGRASGDKGALDAGKAVLRLRKQRRDIALVLAGSSSPEFDRWFEKLPATDQAHIIPLGIVSEETKHALLNRATALLLPSHSDSFGIVLLEAWQHGRPVIGARAGGIPGVIDDGRNGFLVEYGDVTGLANAIGRLLDDPELAEKLGADGLQKVTTDLTWEQTAARAEAAYRQILDRA